MVRALRPVYCITVRSEDSKPINDVIRLQQTIEHILYLCVTLFIQRFLNIDAFFHANARMFGW